MHFQLAIIVVNVISMYYLYSAQSTSKGNLSIISAVPLTSNVIPLPEANLK